jgi:hypothetical protein
MSPTSPPEQRCNQTPKPLPMNILPPTENTTLSILIIAGCTFMANLLYNSTVAYISGYDGLFPTVPVFLAILILGLWRLTEWARKILTGTIIVLSILVPLGEINPFNTLDLLVVPPVKVLAFTTYIPVAVALLYAYLIGRYRSEFRNKII